MSRDGGRECPDCLSEIPAAATFCRFCSQRVEGKRCRECGVRSWREARRCSACGQRFEEKAAQIEFEPFTVTAQRLATLLQRGRFRPQVLRLTREKILLQTPGPFNLSRQEEEIPWRKVAGFDYRSGIFWDQVRIETRGQSSTTMVGLSREDGQRIRRVLQALE